MPPQRKGSENMLDKIDLGKTMGKKEYDERMAPLEIRFGELQRECKELGIPIMILFEGFGASGKGTMINQLIRPLDPRGFQVFATGKQTEEDKMHPYFWRFVTKTPSNGRMHLFDRSWYQGIISDQVISYEEINRFEEQFTEDGNIIIKFFLYINKKEQKNRFEKLESSAETKWRVKKKDWNQNNDYEQYLKRFDEMLIRTDKSDAPWIVVEAMDKQYAACKIISYVVSRLEMAVETKKKAKTKEVFSLDYQAEKFANGVLNGVDLSLDIAPEVYKAERKDLQTRLTLLHNKMYLQRIPVILAFEGWDAGGKGGAIKRITECIDPRGYQVVPVAAPNDIERQHHYLWRFWEKFPKAGHMTIFDRTWYGRVMVERIEGFASEEEWKRAYNEINNMEEHLAKSGTIILKFWMHIDKEEQEERFRQRENTPEKTWKITDEDWRNRAKWDEYEKAVDEMIVRTSTHYAPWIIVEANSKLYARIKVLTAVVEQLEKVLQ